MRAAFDEATGLNLPSIKYFPEYNPKEPESYYSDVDVDEEEGDEDDYEQLYQGRTNTGPAPLQDIPTSSLNAGRPRTVAAGYILYVGAKKNPRERQLGKLTVMFRDGTLWNYYDVTPGEWQSFHAAISKGKYYINKANRLQGADGIFVSKPQGPADLSYVSEKARRTIYRVARSSQYLYSTKRASTLKMYNPTTGQYEKYTRGKGAVPLSAQRRGKYGKNPSRGGKNPNQ